MRDVFTKHYEVEDDNCKRKSVDMGAQRRTVARARGSDVVGKGERLRASHCDLTQGALGVSVCGGAAGRGGAAAPANEVSEPLASEGHLTHRRVPRACVPVCEHVERRTF